MGPRRMLNFVVQALQQIQKQPHLLETPAGVIRCLVSPMPGVQFGETKMVEATTLIRRASFLARGRRRRAGSIR